MLDEIHRLRQELYDLKKNQEIDKNIDLIFINTGKDFSSIEIDLDQEQLDKLFNLGRYQGARFLEEHFEKQFENFHSDTLKNENPE
jgi:hypothetical protein